MTSKYLANHLRFSLSLASRNYRAFSTVQKCYENQDIVTDCSHSLQHFEQIFETDSIKYSFGYGLGVFPQAGYDTAKTKPQIDVVHVVDDATRFHEYNTKQFPKHYSFLRQLGVSSIVKVQEFGAGVYYNPYVSIEDDQGVESMIKYGIVTEDVLFKDLTEWSTFYLAGRLQKPVRHIFGSDNRLKEANDYNLQSAFNLLLVLLALGKKRDLTVSHLFEKIALLSYMGDPRMLVGGENPNKVKNIVMRQMPYFEQLYAPAKELALSRGYATFDKDTLVPSKDIRVISGILSELPLQFRARLARSYQRKYSLQCGKDQPCEGGSDFLDAISGDNYLRRTLLTTILATTAYPALVQSLKGILTAGIVKSTRYAWEKKMKSFKK
ncbi:hypothetical protein PUMCH_002806 [Australozyma saopauloensis]|uniref:Phosphatidate cytidylyltransferase, mitochondrial n=1 Tax=Australozyma saopauloensis TaxID=291208 RepID=A0AAX4HAR6_9ASCO|nr:hypothetical protein PUMCH_002806 [[Candida] saopauloensis]